MPAPTQLVRVGSVVAPVRRDLTLEDLLRVLSELRAEVAGTVAGR